MLETERPSARSPEMSPSSKTGTPGGRDRSALRHTTFAEGERALAPGGAADPRGSALVVGSAQTSEVAHDATFTPQLVKLLDEAPQRSLDDALHTMASSGKPLKKGDKQFATSAQIGAAGARGATGGGKHAMLVANHDYQARSLPDLATLGEASALAATLGGRGYQSEIKPNLTANEMRSAFAVAALGSSARPGDHVVLHYGGHATEAGLCGVKLDGTAHVLAEAREHTRVRPSAPGEAATEEDGIKASPESLKARAPEEGLDPNDLLPHASLNSIAQGAVRKGVHLTMILDACHSGAASDLVHEERDFPAAPGGGGEAAAAQEGAARTPVPDAVEQIRSAKLGLARMLTNWEAERLALKLGPGQDAQQLDDALFDLDLRFASAISRLWREFLLPRVEAALQLVQSLAPGPFPPPPVFTGSLTRGLLCNVKAQPLLERLDHTREAVRALEGARPPTSAHNGGQ